MLEPKTKQYKTGTNKMYTTSDRNHCVSGTSKKKKVRTKPTDQHVVQLNDRNDSASKISKQQKQSYVVSTPVFATMCRHHCKNKQTKNK